MTAEEGGPRGPSIGVLLLEDDDVDAEGVIRALSRAGDDTFEVTRFRRMADGLPACLREPYQVVLLDLHLPDAAGLDSLRRFLTEAPSIPVVVLTGQTSSDVAREAVKAGAQDYLTKDDLDPRLLSRTIRHAIERHRVQIERELTSRRERYQATHDGLTDLPNRQLFRDLLEQGILAARRRGTELAVLFIDLDRFKPVNDTLGHWAGDQVLKAVGVRLEGAVRRSDVVARFGGDEFVVLLHDIARPEDAARAARSILADLAAPFEIDGRQFRISASIGIAIFPGDGDTSETLLRAADKAMFESKEAGPASFRYCSPELQASARDTLSLEGALRTALDDDAIEARFQPILDLDGGAVVGAEVLARWRHPEIGEISPDRFVSVAERCDLIGPLTERIVRLACEQRCRWQHAGDGDIRVAVNVSPRSLQADDFVDVVSRQLRDYGLPGSALELEITESSLVRDLRGTVDRLEALRADGVRITIDDFGTGYSSFNLLRAVPADRVKIDRSFVHGLGETGATGLIASAIVGLGESMSLEVVADGVETEEQFEVLRAHGCRLMQGNLFAEPSPPSDRLPAIRWPEVTLRRRPFPAGTRRPASRPSGGP